MGEPPWRRHPAGSSLVNLCALLILRALLQVVVGRHWRKRHQAHVQERENPRCERGLALAQKCELQDCIPASAFSNVATTCVQAGNEGQKGSWGAWASCPGPPPYTVAGGAALRSQPDQQGGDDMGAWLVQLVAGGLAVFKVAADMNQI